MYLNNTTTSRMTTTQQLKPGGFIGDESIIIGGYVYLFQGLTPRDKSK